MCKTPKKHEKRGKKTGPPPAVRHGPGDLHLSGLTADMEKKLGAPWCSQPGSQDNNGANANGS